MAWLIQNMVWASAAMLLVLALRRPIAWAFGAGVAYALWLIPLARLVAPPVDWFDGLLPSAQLPPVVTLLDVGGTGAASSAAAGSGIPWLTLLFGLWVTGTLAFLVVQAVLYRTFVARLSLSVRSIGSHRGVPLIESAAVDGPLALGLLDRRIVVPARFEERYAPAERAFALDHEHYHHRRADILANHVALVVLALNWFNPIAWFAFRAFRADQELSCDAAVAATADLQGRSDYGRALVKAASKPGLIAVCPLNHVDQLKRRLKMLNHHRRDRRRLFAGSAVTMGLLTGSLILGSPSLAQPAQSGADKQERREHIIIMDRVGDRGDAASGEHRDVHIRRHLSPEIAERIEGCRDGNEAVNVRDGEGDRRTHFMLCMRDNASPAQQVEALQRARDRLAQEDHLSGEAKQRVLAEIDRAIARARGN